jgi:hypothetical protein
VIGTSRRSLRYNQRVARRVWLISESLQEDEMTSQSAIDTLAEFAAINTAIHRVLSHLARQSPNPSAFLLEELGLGLGELAKSNYWGVSLSQQKRVIETAKKRYSDMILSIHPT